MFVCDLLVGLAEFPWVVGHRPLGTLPFILGSLSEYPWVLPVCSLLAFCLLLACRDARMRLYRVEASFSFCLSPCLPGRSTPCLYGEVAFPHVAAWSLYRVGSLLGPPRYGLLWWGRSFIHRPKVNLPARRDCPRQDVLVLFVCLFV